MFLWVRFLVYFANISGDCHAGAKNKQEPQHRIGNYVGPQKNVLCLTWMEHKALSIIICALTAIMVTFVIIMISFDVSYFHIFIIACFFCST